MTVNSNSSNETVNVASELAKRLNGNEIIALFGEMGAGKTAFVTGLAEGLDIKESVSSPTFALVHEHSGKYSLYHFDMYRVTSWDDLESSGFFDYIGKGVIACEWSENIENALPKEHIRVQITKTGENSRTIEITEKRT